MFVACWWGLASAGTVDDALALAEPYRSGRLLGSVPTIPRDAYERAANGEVVTGNADTGEKLKRVWGVTVVDVPIDRFWAALNDDESKPGYSDLAHVELLSGDACQTGRVVFQYLDVSVLSDRWWVVEQRQNTAMLSGSSGKVREVTWRSLTDGESRLNEQAKTWAKKGTQVPFTEGAWFLVDLGEGKTLVEYVAASDPGGIVPAGLAASFASGSIANTFEGMKKLALAGGHCSP
ncbi:MAG: hypothetical protein H6738_02120 [Alphaproteobacteria bacterium]|nr:hypothetical protein [Alphaproteobacteria bacterium]MCB9695565.1 hypothetical protein [Alphaproteobacteria bacterium]